MSVSVFCVLIFSGIAALLDLCTRKIPNTVILGGWFTGLGLWLGKQGYIGGLYWLSGAFGILLLGMILYLLRGVGAGDVKLLSVAGGILGLHRGLWLYLAALFWGAVLGLAVILKRGEGLACLRRMGAYIREIFVSGKAVWREEQGVKICYATAIFGASFALAVKEGGWIEWLK